jgi:hypothetical protein
MAYLLATAVALRGVGTLAGDGSTPLGGRCRLQIQNRCKSLRGSGGSADDVLEVLSYLGFLPLRLLHCFVSGSAQNARMTAR